MWSSQRELRWSALRQLIVTVACLAAMGAIFWYQPTIVNLFNDALFGRGFVPSEYESKILSNYYTYGWYSLLFGWIGLEISGFVLLWFKAKPDDYPEFQTRLRTLAQKEGISPPTLIVLRGVGKILNAAATQGLFSGRKVIVLGPIIEILADKEQDYVAAHELRHISGADIWMKIFVVVGNIALSLQKWALLVSLIYDFAAYGWRELVFLLTTWGVLWGTHTIYKFLAAAHSRAREYAADIGAVEIVGWADRVHLITGLARIQHTLTGWRAFKIFHPDDGLFDSHPSVLRRAQALQLEVRDLGDGSVQIGGIVIESGDVVVDAATRGARLSHP